MASSKRSPLPRASKADASAREQVADTGRWWRSAVRPLAVLATISAVVWLVYGRGIHAPMIFDDGNSIVHNPSIKHLWPLFGTADAPGPLAPEKDFCTSGRPLVNFSLAVNYYFSHRFDPTGYHVFNAWVHVANAFLLWAIVRRTLRLDFFTGRFDAVAEPLALAVALLWALHPLQIDAVQYITQRTELMMGFCYLLVLLASLHYWSAETTAARSGWLVLATASCVAGAACKEVMVSAPAMILLFERTFIAGSFRRALRQSWPLYAGLMLGWGMILLLNVGGPRSESAGFGVNLPAYVWWFTQTHVLIYYLRLAIRPWPLVIHYEFPHLETFAAAGPWLLAVALLAAVTIVLVWRRTAAGFLLTWVVAILSPTLVVPIVTEVAAERRMYLPMAALVSLTIVGGYELLSRYLAPPNRARGRAADRRTLVLVCSAAGLLALIYGALDVKRLAMFEEPLVLWKDALIHQPGSSTSQFNVGITLSSQGKQAESIPYFEEAIRIKPDDGGTHNNLGFALLMTGRTAEALQHIERAIQLKPDSAAAHNNMGMALAGLGRTQQATQEFSAALKLQPEYGDAAINLGTILLRSGQPLAALDPLQQALAWDPERLEIFAPLLNAYMDLGRTDDAIATARQGLLAAHRQKNIDLANQLQAWLAEHSATAAKK
jgi:Flp pilus assembly protein TadD